MTFRKNFRFVSFGLSVALYIKAFWY